MSLIYMVLLFEAIACEACGVRPGPVMSIWSHQGRQHTHPSTQGPKAQEERCHLWPFHPLTQIQNILKHVSRASSLRPSEWSLGSASTWANRPLALASCRGWDMPGPQWRSSPLQTWTWRSQPGAHLDAAPTSEVVMTDFTEAKSRRISKGKCSLSWLQHTPTIIWQQNCLVNDANIDLLWFLVYLALSLRSVSWVPNNTFWDISYNFVFARV